MWWFVVIFSYFLGAVPTAYIAGRLTARQDIREIGDQNVGAANAFRELSRRTGIVVGLIDAGKGAAVILVAMAMDLPQLAILAAGLAAVIGHNWPIYLKFRGGRGVSTTLGILFTLVTIPMLIMTIPTLLVLIIKRNVSRSMAFLFILLPVIELLMRVPLIIVGYGLLLPILVGITTWIRTRPKELKPAESENIDTK